MFNINNAEILQIADSVAKEKGLNRDIILTALEHAIAAAGKKKYGNDESIRSSISRNTGEIRLFRARKIVEAVEIEGLEISLSDAKYLNSSAELGGYIEDDLPPIDLGRLPAITAKEVIFAKVLEAEKDKQYEDFKDRVGEILSGLVRRVEKHGVYVDLGRVEAFIRKDQLIPNENYKINDRIKAYFYEIKKDNVGPQIMLSRTNPQFITKLLEQDVPEVYDGLIQIKGVVREPGSKAKLAVFANDMGTDAVAACIGVRGSRIRAITEELMGEKIDVFEWNKDLAKYAVNALGAQDVQRVIINQETKTIEAIINAESLSKIIGRKGQNVRLVSRLLGWKVDVLTEEEESKRRNEEFTYAVSHLVKELNIDEVIAQLLVVEGFESTEKLCEAELSDILKIEGFEKELAIELKERAQKYLEEKEEGALKKLEEAGVTQELLDLLDLELDIIVDIAEAGIKTPEDLSEVGIAELRALTRGLLSREELIELIEKSKTYLS